MKRPHQVTAILLLLISTFYGREALALPLYGMNGLGSGFLPLCLATFLCLLAALMLFQATFRSSEPLPNDFFPTVTGYTRIGAILLALLAAGLLLVPLGFRLTMLSFLVFLLFALGRQNILVTALISLAGSFGVFYVFFVWLKVPLPVGMFGI